MAFTQGSVCPMKVIIMHKLLQLPGKAGQRYYLHLTAKGKKSTLESNGL